MLGLLSWPARSRTHAWNVYVDPSVRPLTVTFDPVPSYTAVPEVTDDGGVVPVARRTITWSRSGIGGSVHDRLACRSAPVAWKLLTGSGGRSTVRNVLVNRSVGTYRARTRTM